jgi:hypothetical protein
LGIPSSIVIGPFHVLTENVRQALSKKRKALANALLELLARILRSKVDNVSKLKWSFPVSLKFSVNESTDSVFGRPYILYMAVLWVYMFQLLSYL